MQDGTETSNVKPMHFTLLNAALPVEDRLILPSLVWYTVLKTKVNRGYDNSVF